MRLAISRAAFGRLARNQICILSACWLVASACSAGAADWPQFRGPERTGISKETGLLKSWPADGPKLLWKVTNLGEGHAAPSVANGRIYGMGRRVDDEVVWALDEKTGKEAWSAKIADGITLGGAQGGYGPRSTPTIDGNLLYTLGVAGDLVCMDTATGKIRWRKNLVTEFGGRVPQWGYSESPLIDGTKVIVTPGNGQATLVALNKMTGAPVWTSQVPGRNGAAYSSCLVAAVDGQKQYIQFLSGGVVGVSASDGKFLWHYDTPANGSGICCSMPIYRDHQVFAASSYRTGGGLANLPAGGGGAAASEVYFTPQMQNHHGGMVLVGDYLYGFDDRNRGLVCMEWKTGNVKWVDPSVVKGSITCVDGMLYCRSERGPVALVEANSNSYVEKGRFDQPDRSRANSWPYPVVANGRLYLRDQDILLCYDVSQKSASRQAQN